ncbi:hypothetical protein OKW21_006063 [Catalinimonas alkaloidigena]|uniref:hypothetical protein n=1 Tax=Catalinimonas alkaloidigena TaxID=1075417 RepID=UPI002404E3E6|nr:hypothetical protein [Catalinimonas alkaloidigena]MDF9800800.1 hypothetical protein [Catalinimonas alkaloidigena]
MSQKNLPVTYFFHSDDTLSTRKKVYNEYVKKYDTQLFMIENKEKSPKIVTFSNTEEEYKKADGIFIGDLIS